MIGYGFPHSTKYKIINYGLYRGGITDEPLSNLMHQTAHHRRNRTFYPLVNKALLLEMGEPF